MKIFTILLFFPFLICCGNQKHANTSVVQTANIKAMNDTTPVTVNDTFPLIVQFYSIGEGINYDSKTLLDNFISEFEKKNKKSIAYQVVHWGREGEYDACFRLANLNKEQQRLFINELKKIYNEKSLVHILENENCRYIR